MENTTAGQHRTVTQCDEHSTKVLMVGRSMLCDMWACATRVWQPGLIRAQEQLSPDEVSIAGLMQANRITAVYMQQTADACICPNPGHAALLIL
jgi:hypothetical protein